MYYEQGASSVDEQTDDLVFGFPHASPSLSFDDSILESVQEAWRQVMDKAAVDADYMTFEDREGANDEEDMYD